MQKSDIGPQKLNARLTPKKVEYVVFEPMFTIKVTKWVDFSLKKESNSFCLFKMGITAVAHANCKT